MNGAGGLRPAVSGPVMSGGIKADHGERGRGDHEAEEVGEFGGHGSGVVVGAPKGSGELLTSQLTNLRQGHQNRLSRTRCIDAIGRATMDAAAAAAKCRAVVDDAVADLAEDCFGLFDGHWLGGLPMT